MLGKGKITLRTVVARTQIKEFYYFGKRIKNNKIAKHNNKTGNITTNIRINKLYFVSFK